MSNIELPPLPNTIDKLRPRLPKPMLPQDLPAPSADPAPYQLRHGCYLMQYTPATTALPGIHTQVHYHGTMRVEQHEPAHDTAEHSLTDTLTVSADLYIQSSPDLPDLTNGIPIFPRAQYHYYLRVLTIEQTDDPVYSIILEFERYRHNQTRHTWSNEGRYRVSLQPEQDQWAGDVMNESSLSVGQMNIRWVSPYLRQAIIEIDRVAQAELPLDNGQGLDWQAVFKTVDWDITLQLRDAYIDEPSGKTWSQAELHAAMLKHRDSSDLDRAWHYHLLCVRQIEDATRGIMYDSEGTDSNNLPREGAAIAAHWMIPDEPRWGSERGQRFDQATELYFRTAVHEIGHTMGLRHIIHEPNFMMATSILTRHVGNGEFPDNIDWLFAEINAKRLRHMPDPWVRPGMMPANRPFSTTPISRDDMHIEVEQLALTIEPLLDVVPIGAPVRIDLELQNQSNEPIAVPGNLSLKSEYVRGVVIDPAGTERTFQSLVRCLDGEPLQLLAGQQRTQHGMTLLRGIQGALFPTPGLYQIQLEVLWNGDGVLQKSSGTTHIMVTPPVDEDHARAALKVLSTPDLLLTLAIGGDHLVDGIDALQIALESPVLRPHFAVIEAKRIGHRFGDRVAQPEAACALIDESIVVSRSEIKRVAEIIQQTRREDRHVGAISQAIEILRAKIAQMYTNSGEAIAKMVERL